MSVSNGTGRLPRNVCKEWDPKGSPETSVRNGAGKLSRNAATELPLYAA